MKNITIQPKLNLDSLRAFCLANPEANPITDAVWDVTLVNDELELNVIKDLAQ